MHLRALLVVAGIATLVAAAPARAATFTVTGSDDGTGSCAGTTCTTLRAALTEAQQQTGPDTIKLGAVTYNLTLGQLAVSSELTINGANAATTAIRGDGKSGRVFSIGADQRVTISHATIANGFAEATSTDMGGDVLVNTGAQLTLDHVRITGGTAFRGGGLAIAGGGAAQITNSLIDNNQVVGSPAGGSGEGGGIWSQGNAKVGTGNVLTLTDSTVTGNHALSSAGIVARDDTRNRTTLTRVTVAGNSAGTNSGGPGIFVSDAESFTVASSIVSGNTGDGVPVNCGGKLTSGGGNIDSGSSCGLAGSADLQYTDPQLGSLLPAGGETPVLAIAATSPAVDFGAPCTGTDQRDLPRPDGKSCDSGAYELDVAPPAPVITTPPTDVLQRSATVNLAGTGQTGASVEIFEGRTSKGTVTATGGKWNLQLTGVADGPHTYTARATDGGGTSPSSAPRTVTVDTIAPGAPAITTPSGNVLQKTPTVTLSGTAESGASVEIFDGTLSKGSVPATGGTWTTTLTGVADGAHVYTAKATDPAGNTSAASTSRTVTVDTGPPDTSVASGPAGLTNTRSPSFTFSSEAGSTFQCRLDGPGATMGAYAACTTPKVYSGLVDGDYTFRVFATDVAGNPDVTPATRTFTVDATPPPADVVSGPDGPTTDAAPAFGFTSTDAQTVFECKLDGPGAALGTFGPCTSPTSFAGLAPGAYVFSVQATDPAGNKTVKTRSFTVTLPQQATPTPTPTPTPVSGKSVVIAPVSGKTLIKKPGSTKFVPVDFTQGIPLGSIVDTRHSKIRLFAIPKPGRPVESALFYDGIFKVTQIGTITQLQLVEALAACKATKATAAAKKPKTRKLWGDGSGSFRTRGQYSAATVRGTKWLVQDSCGKTLTKVAKGVVSVQDFIKHKTILVRAPKRYTARR